MTKRQKPQVLADLVEQDIRDQVLATAVESAAKTGASDALHVAVLRAAALELYLVALLQHYGGTCVLELDELIAAHEYMLDVQPVVTENLLLELVIDATRLKPCAE